ncbi:MAG TPA: SDR family oxidoreductase [Ramlibacter sp.]|nr:SDR family oxidoreductase [Ramlibacter sp.]
MKRLTGKVAVVTGGASGIGAATCRRLVQEGAQVAIGDLDALRAYELAKELGDAAQAVPFDAGDVTSVQALIAATVERFGRLDILHNNAAIMANEHIRKDSNPVDIDFDVWDKTFAVNVRGYVAACKYAIPHMLKVGGGAIVMTSSGSAHRGDLSNIAYGASKAAVVNFARYVATIYGKQGIRCNTVCPGLIRTEGGKKNVFGPMVKVMEDNTLTPRLGLPEDIAAAVAFLVSDDGAFVTGQDIAIDGGMLSHMPYYSDFMNAAAAW